MPCPVTLRPQEGQGALQWKLTAFAETCTFWAFAGFAGSGVGCGRC
jgi:hypothetical protein